MLRRLWLGLAVTAWLAPALAAVDSSCPTKPLTILLTNDDGFDRPGIRALREALTRGGHHVMLVAPAANASGAAASVNFAPVAVAQPEAGVYAVGGSPATAVILATTALFPRDDPPDLVISGINEGANLGPATPISGTVGATIAAIEALELPLPAVAVSTDLIAKDATDPVNVEHFGRVASFVARLVTQLQVRRCQTGWLLPDGMALNVNYPPLEPRKIKGVQVLKQGRGRYFSIRFEASKDDPRTYLPVMTKRPPKDDSSDADTTAYNQGFITVVPLDGDYTADARERSALRPLTLERLAP